MSDFDITLYECYCPECDKDWYPDAMELDEAVSAHNNIMHDGEPVAERRPVDPATW